MGFIVNPNRNAYCGLITQWDVSKNAWLSHVHPIKHLPELCNLITMDKEIVGKVHYECITLLNLVRKLITPPL